MSALPRLAGLAGLLVLFPSLARAGAPALPERDPGVTSAFARPSPFLDPARLSLSTTVSFGTDARGRGHGLQVTSLRYRFTAPLSLEVNLGSLAGPAARTSSGFFLEAASLTWRPSATSWLRVDYRDLRSPLQRAIGPGWPQP